MPVNVSRLHLLLQIHMTNFIQAFGWRGFKFIWMKDHALLKGEIIATSWILFTQERMLSAKFGWYWRSDSGKVSSMCFSYIFCHYFQVENGVSLCLTKLESPSLCVLCVNFEWNWSIGFGEEDENWKVYRQTDGRTTVDLKCSLELKWEENGVVFQLITLLHIFACMHSRECVYCSSMDTHCTKLTKLY